MDNKEKTPDVLYQFFILAILVKLGGSARTEIVKNKIKEFYGNQFTAKDLEDCAKSKEAHWENDVRWARQHLIKAGCLSRSSARGIWAITDKGREEHKKLAEMLRQK